eukprot:jgi/Tetstr1/427111/TSEL_017314.t1
MKIRRVVVSSAERSRGAPYNFASPLQEQHLNVFAGQTTRFALEWITPVRGSDLESDFASNDFHPLAVLLICPSFTQLNQYKNFERNSDAVLGLLQGDPSGKALYGATADTPYVQRTACGGMCLGDQLATLSELEFRFREAPTRVSTGAYEWEPTFAEDIDMSLVFWEEEPERAVAPAFYNMWFSTGAADVLVGAAAYGIPFRMPALARDPGGWQMAVSYCSPVHVPTPAPAGLLLTTDLIQSDTDNRRRVLAYLPGAGGSFFGVKRTVKPVCEDTVGVPVRQLPLDDQAYLNIEVRDAVTYAMRPNASQFIFCLTFYKI